jgi:hypothetical protein
LRIVVAYSRAIVVLKKLKRAEKGFSPMSLTLSENDQM